MIARTTLANTVRITINGQDLEVDPIVAISFALDIYQAAQAAAKQRARREEITRDLLGAIRGWKL